MNAEVNSVAGIDKKDVGNKQQLTSSHHRRPYGKRELNRK